MSLESDLAAAFADLWATKALTFGAQGTRGYLDQADRQMQTQEHQLVMARVTTFQYQTSALTGVVRDSEVSIEGVDYTVEHVEKLGDGLISELWLMAVDS